MSSNIAQHERTVVYTAVTADYDLIYRPRSIDDGFEYVLISESASRETIWQFRPLVKKLENDVLTNRYHKLFPHKIFPDANYSIYLDGNIGIIGSLQNLMNEFIGSKAAIGVFRHSARNTVAEEIDACLLLDKFDTEDKLLFRNQYTYFIANGMPIKQRLSDNGVIFRWHGHPDIPKSMDDWWWQLNHFTKRDQLSLPYVVWSNSCDINIWDWSIREPNAYFECYDHRSNLLKNMKNRLKNARHRNQSMKSLYDSINAVLPRIIR